MKLFENNMIKTILTYYASVLFEFPDTLFIFVWK